MEDGMVNRAKAAGRSSAMSENWPLNVAMRDSH